MQKYNLKYTAKMCFLAVVFLLIGNLHAQQYYFDNYSVKEGLAQSSVYAVEQAGNGELWLATASGVSKFNGNDFINYTTEDGLAEGAVKTIYIDEKETVWLGHVGGGISRIINDSIEVALHMGADITSFAGDNEGNLWASSYKGGVIKIQNPSEVDKAKLNFKQYKGQEGISDVVFQVYKLNNGNVCFVTDVGIKYYIEQKDNFKKLSVKEMPSYFQITIMYESSNGSLWFGTYNGGAYEFNRSKNQLKIYDYRDGLAHNWITSFHEDKNGNMWIGTWGGGVTRVGKESKLTSIGVKNGLLDEKIRCISGDKEGNVLFGTKENGLLLFKGDQFEFLGKNQGLIDEHVWAILEDANKSIWVGTNKGITVFEDNKPIRQFSEESGLSFEEVRFIKQDKDNNVWLGTWGGGLMKFNDRYNKFDMNYQVNMNMAQPLVTALDIDNENNLWVGSTDGLVYYEIDNNVGSRLSQDDGLYGNDISAIYADENNIVWVGSRGKGIAKISGSKIEKVQLGVSFTANCFIKDKDGNLLIGTDGKGVFVFNGKKVTKKITTDDGLLSDYISLINIDNNGDVWIGTNKGLNRLSHTDGKISSYGEKMGYIGIESKPNASFKDQEGNLWFGTIKGAVKLNTSKVVENKLEPISKITRMRVNLEDRAMEHGLSLSYKEKSVIFDYSSICLTNPEAVRYQVMLEGADEDWRPITKQNFVTYSPLPPGNYKFKLKACNNNGVWNKEPITYSFKITPPFWQTAWFIGLCVILVLIGVVAFIKVREKQLLKEKKVLEEKVQERTEEVVQKSQELERKNKDIIDSITYAKRIQDAILPTNDKFTQELNQTFVLFEPKDIVSGDFYWLATKDDKILFAAADCTGHGVPGAFMSIVGHNLLDKIVGEYEITEPAKILDELNKGIEQTLRKEKGSDVVGIKDGMDIAICSFNKSTKVLEYSGAYNPLYIVSKKEIKSVSGESFEANITEDEKMLFEVKSDRFPIGNYSEDNKRYTNHEIQLNDGDTIYLFSDGYADQFGGPKGKKFRYKQFKQTLLALYDEGMESQKEVLHTTLKSWRGDIEQIDDVIVIGSRV